MVEAKWPMKMLTYLVQLLLIFPLLLLTAVTTSPVAVATVASRCCLHNLFTVLWNQSSKGAPQRGDILDWALLE